MKSKSLFLLLILAAFFVVPVQAEEENREVGSFNLQSYVPARILISYAYTNNFSVTDVSSLGQSLYKITSGPTSIEFLAEDIDRYTFTVEIKYSAIVTQSIQIALFSTNLAPEGIQFNVKASVMQIKFTLTVTEEPKYPSAEDVAEQVVRQVSNELTTFELKILEIVGTQNRNLATQWVLVLLSLGLGVGIMLVLVIRTRPQYEDVGRRA